MGLFKRKKQEVILDTRTDIERKFEEKGQAIGAKTGSFVQKGKDKLDEVKEKLREDGTLDKMKNLSTKVDDKIDQVVDAVSKKGKEVKDKITKKKDIDSTEEYYE